MILRDFKDFPRTGRLIGIDWGARRTGVAVSDASRGFTFARPAVVSQSGAGLLDRVVEIIRAEAPSGIVIGLPLRSDGTDSATTVAVREFGLELSRRVEIPIIYVDETLSSASAAAEIGRATISDIKSRLDSESARLILDNAIAVISRVCEL